jgi:hypothetical protein
MKLGISLPNTLAPEVDRRLMLDWARLADEAGFSSFGTIDKPNYDSWDPLATLAAAAAVTERARLTTTILQLPNRNEVLVAKQAAVIDRLSAGRMVLGVGQGAREDDFEVFGAKFLGRARRLEAQVPRIREVWAGAPAADEDRGVLGPAPVQEPGPPIWIGGASEPAVARAVRLGDGYVFGTRGPDWMAEHTPKIREDAVAQGEAGLHRRRHRLCRSRQRSGEGTRGGGAPRPPLLRPAMDGAGEADPPRAAGGDRRGGGGVYRRRPRRADPLRGDPSPRPGRTAGRAGSRATKRVALDSLGNARRNCGQGAGS